MPPCLFGASSHRPFRRHRGDVLGFNYEGGRDTFRALTLWLRALLCGQQTCGLRLKIQTRACRPHRWSVTCQLLTHIDTRPYPSPLSHLQLLMLHLVTSYFHVELLPYLQRRTIATTVATSFGSTDPSISHNHVSCVLLAKANALLPTILIGLVYPYYLMLLTLSGTTTSQHQSFITSYQFSRLFVYALI